MLGLFIGGLLHQRVVTGCTEVGPLIFEQRVVLGTMAIMTADATSRFDGLMNDRLGEFTLSFGMALVTDLIGTAGQHVFTVGTVWIMTAGAHVIADRLVLLRHFVQIGFDLLVTAQAVFPFGWCSNQSRKFCRMGVVARETTIG